MSRVSRVSRVSNGSYNGVESWVNTRRHATLDESNYVGAHIYTGVKWQCLEFVRRYLILRYGISFGPVRDVYDFWQQCGRARICQVFVHNPRPQPDDLVLLHDSHTGHIGIVTEFDRRTQTVRVADQNFQYGKYWKTPTYAYEMSIHDGKIFGWVRFK